jgi:hypothetical protein
MPVCQFYEIFSMQRNFGRAIFRGLDSYTMPLFSCAGLMRFMLRRLVSFFGNHKTAAVLMVTGLVSVSAAPASAGMDRCPEGYDTYRIGKRPVCVQQGFPPYERSGAIGVHSLSWRDFYDVAEGMLPNGTKGLRVRPAGTKPLDPSKFEPGPFDGTRLRRYGPFRLVYADNLTFRGRPVAIDCKKALSPSLDDTPAQYCYIRGRLSDAFGFRLEVLTFSWLDKPAWPVFDAEYAKTWPSLLADLDVLLTEFIILPEQED